MARYIDNPQSQKDEGSAAEWEVTHLFQEIGDFAVIHLQHAKDEAALIHWDGYNTISPDIFVMRGDDRFFVEIKSKNPTSYGTLGFPDKTISHYWRLFKKSKIEILLVIRDKSVAPVGVRNTEAFRFALLGPDLFQDAVLYGGHWYFQPSRFMPFVEWLEEDKEDFEDYNQNLKDFAAGRCESFVDVIDRLIAADAEASGTAPEEAQDAA
jgi:hypothetical protein